MDCDVMSELEPAKDDDMSCDDSSTKNRWEGYTIKIINNVKTNSFGGHLEYVAKNNSVQHIYEEIENR
eukprot:2826135-Ditylum_brightwellii.AAC.1